jgi:hypothetical protein
MNFEIDRESTGVAMVLTPYGLGYLFERSHVDEDGDNIPASVIMMAHHKKCGHCDAEHALGIRFPGIDESAAHIAAMETTAKHYFGEVGVQAAIDRARAEIRHKRGW